MSPKNVAVFSAVLVLLAGASAPVAAQHEGHTMPADTTKKKPAAKPRPKSSKAPVKKAPAKPRVAAKPDTTKAPAMKPLPSRPHAGHDMMSGPLSLPMDRMGSGTTWIPDAVTLPSRHRNFGPWDVMAHGFVFVQYDNQSGRRGDDQLGSLNWAMFMASRELAGGHFQARTMLSLDPATVTSAGYPLLLQTGELHEGEPLRDRQHPHDFWMELAVLYQREVNDRLAWSVYAAPSGEPALGPVAFMHRPSAMDNPAAPLAHHWQDATHVSFGVITGGMFTRRWQVEASAFNGREPDEHRWNFDPIRLDSYSARLTLNPSANWSLSAGAGFLDSPESLHPDESLRRYTVSALHGKKLDGGGQAASAAVWGANRHASGSAMTHSFLLENETILDSRNTVFGRAELVQKTGEELGLPPDDAGIAEKRLNLGAMQVGYIREVARFGGATLGLGAATTLNIVPRQLEDAYGSRRPIGSFFFMRLRPSFGSQSMNTMGGMQ